jgi:hypothetical protein
VTRGTSALRLFLAEPLNFSSSAFWSMNCPVVLSRLVQCSSPSILVLSWGAVLHGPYAMAVW